MNSPRLITLTLKSGPEDSLVDLLSLLRESFRRLRKQVGWKQHVDGGVYTIEITHNRTKGSWHPHLHIVADGRFWSQGEIASAWEEASGGSRIVDIRKINDAAAAAKYIANYVSKPHAAGEWEGSEIAEWAVAVHRQRLAHTFGNQHGKQVEGDDGEVEVRAADDLGSTLWIRTAANRGHRVAQRIVDLVRVGPRVFKQAFGLREEDEREGCWETAEKLELVVLAETLRAEWMREATNEPPPTRKPHDAYLFAIHDAHNHNRSPRRSKHAG